MPKKQKVKNKGNYVGNLTGRSQEQRLQDNRTRVSFVLLLQFVSSLGDPKTRATPGPWTSPTDWVHGPPPGPVHGPSIRTTPTDSSKNSIEKKMNGNINSYP